MVWGLWGGGSGVDSEGGVKIALAAAYLGSIVAAAYAITHVGNQHDPHGPHVLPVWPGIEAPSGVYVVGVTLVLRDLLQHRVSKGAMFALIVVGTTLAAFVSPAVAVASGLAFAASESVDYAVFSALQKHGTYRAIAASNAVALVVDSVLFLAIAFGSLAFVEGQVIGKALSTVAAIGVLFLIGRARKVVAR